MGLSLSEKDTQWTTCFGNPKEGVREIGFVTGVSVDNRPYCQSATEPKAGGEAPAMAPCPDFSAFCISRRVWEHVGPFDERMVFYAGDNDYHVRAARAGLPLMNCGAPFYHERSSTLRQASAEERAQIEAQANADRAVFKSLYGCNPWDPEYAALITT
jgi:GT2 family glycosyltransferase